MTLAPDRIVLAGMRFDGHLGVTDEERATLQPIELDLEMSVDLAAAGRSDDLGRTVDYGAVFSLCRATVEGRSFNLLEAVAETIAARVLENTPVEQLVVRVRKLRVPVDGRLEYAGVEITRTRSGGAAHVADPSPAPPLG